MSALGRQPSKDRAQFWRFNDSERGTRRYAEADKNITRWSDIEDGGGHFAALEEPEILIDDMSEFFRSVR